MALAQTRVGDDLMTSNVGNLSRCVHRPAEIAAVKRGKSLPSKPRTEGFRLRHSFSR